MAILLKVKIGSFFALKESLLTVLNKKIFEYGKGIFFFI